MTVNKVLVFNSPKGRFKENDIKEVEAKLLEFGIESRRYAEAEGFDYDAVIVLGGDGTMLNAFPLAYNESKPILCINFGTLGYMSELEKSELNMLSALKDGFETEKRMLIKVTAKRGNELIAQAIALNEAVVARPADGDIAFLELKCDNAAVCDYRADGVIVATPTGSSAYAMSAGVPIIDTKLEAICVCPICPHVMGARAMVFSPNSVLEIVNLNGENRTDNILVCDGKAVCQIKQGDVVKIERSDKYLEMIKIKKDAFYEILYKKMS